MLQKSLTTTFKLLFLEPEIFLNPPPEQIYFGDDVTQLFLLLHFQVRKQEQEFSRYGLEISRREMAHWTILCTERYLSLLYGCMHKKLYDYHVLQANETPVRVKKENRTEGSKHYIWVYRTGKMYQDRPIVLYDYQPMRNTSHPRKFIKDFRGVCVTDGYQVYHTLEEERNDLTIAGC